MSTISVRLPDNLLAEAKKYARELHMAQSEYIRKAIEILNQQNRQEKQYRELKAVSLRVRENSMRINAEFENIEDDPIT